MAKKNFKKGLNSLFQENSENINKLNEEKEKISSDIDIENISDEKLKWLLIKIQRYEKELKLWRTGKLNIEKFNESLKDFNLEYDPETNEIKPK